MVDLCCAVTVYVSENIAWLFVELLGGECGDWGDGFGHFLFFHDG